MEEVLCRANSAAEDQTVSEQSIQVVHCKPSIGMLWTNYWIVKSEDFSILRGVRMII